MKLEAKGHRKVVFFFSACENGDMTTQTDEEKAPRFHDGDGDDAVMVVAFLFEVPGEVVIQIERADGTVDQMVVDEKDDATEYKALLHARKIYSAVGSQKPEELQQTKEMLRQGGHQVLDELLKQDEPVVALKTDTES